VINLGEDMTTVSKVRWWFGN